MSPIQRLLTFAGATALLLSVPTPQAAAAFGTHPTAARRVADPGGENVSIALESIRAKADIPGVVAMAVQGGEVVAWGAAGVRAYGSDDALRIDDPIHHGSCAKAMTSTLAAILVEEGVMKWETTLAEALPEFAKKVDGGFHGVTLEAAITRQSQQLDPLGVAIAQLHQNLCAAAFTAIIDQQHIKLLRQHCFQRRPDRAFVVIHRNQYRGAEQRFRI